MTLRGRFFATTYDRQMANVEKGRVASSPRWLLSGAAVRYWRSALGLGELAFLTALPWSR
jgi:hypothetical protein